MAAIKQALISVSDKSGVLEFAQGLDQLGVKILSTGGTAKLLADNGIPVTEVADYTGFPEMLDGRVKTLQPKVHAGILARRDLPEHVATLKKHGIPTIDLVVVNLYPFAATIAKPDCTLEDAIENIDIGGPTMVRAAAKNHGHVAIVTDPADYADVLAEMQTNNGAVSDATRFDLAKKAFSHTAAYDSTISNYLTAINADGTRSAFPAQINFNFAKVQDMRYGENPHQSAAFYRDLNPVAGGISDYAQLQGKELSYNNIGDASGHRNKVAVERRLLMRVFAVAHVLHLGEIEIDLRRERTLRTARIDRSEIVADRRIVGGSVRERLLRQIETCRVTHRAVVGLHLGQH